MRIIWNDRLLLSVILTSLVLLLFLPAVETQESALPEADIQSWDVFVQYEGDQTASAELVFLNLLTGEVSTLGIAGERFSLLENDVMYYAHDVKRVRLASPDGAIVDHPFISVSPETYRIDWIVSDDQHTIAWTLTSKDENSLLQTSTMIADVAIGEVREVLAAGPWKGSRVLPLAFNAEKDELYMDAHPDGVDEYLPYALFANLFALDLLDGSIRSLPGESSCFCSAAIGNDKFLRFSRSADSGGVDVIVDSLDGGKLKSIPAVDIDGFAQAGDALISPDGTLAAYVLALRGALVEAERTIFVLADLETLEQKVLGSPVTGLAYLINWTEDNSALIFTNQRQSGTWKLDLSDGSVHKVAEARYLGRLQSQ